ncbi:M13-type metalloendopeptidase [Nevskia sp.]|uniref:M13 family metallopeptidase n=1 Tax=Nevskia sp. TaxID=1929292 RepID=UPI0025E1483C|nr:M13-type metalloendopeptidase [Nevskia sp.]
MKRTILMASALALLAGCGKTAEAPKPVAPLSSGIDGSHIDAAIRPQDDLYRHLSGKWLESFEIPADKARYGSFTKLSDDSEANLKAIIEAAAAIPEVKPGTEAQQIGDLFKSYLDEAKVEAVGLKPLAETLRTIEQMTDKALVPGTMATLSMIGVGSPFVPFVHQDNKDSTKYIVDVYQYGLGLPDRDYYLKDTEKYVQTRMQYQAHIEKMLGLAGDKDAAAKAKAIFGFETELAKIQWDKVENRDPVKTYNKFELAKLAELAPGFDFSAWLAAGGMTGKLDYLIVSQPTYVTGVAKLLKSAPLATWKAYFQWRVLSEFAPYLPKAFVDENFAFFGSALRGIPENRPRWKRGVELVEGSIGEALGKLYVEKHFPPDSKARMETLVTNLQAAYKSSIDTLPWMSEATKKEAQTKLAKFSPKIGYPSKWKDYSKLIIAPDDLIGNVARARALSYQMELAKLGKPIDREEWGMTPQTVNAYYNPEKNEIVFPAAILQPPFFTAAADDAVNYGGIGAVIGHEISHGFDDQGSQYDGDGNLRQWFTEDDLKNFKERTTALVAQYAAYEPVKGYHVNGELTLGENVADLSGLAIAYKAYKLSLGGKEAPVIDGLTGDQRFYLGWAQVWRSKEREAETIRRLTVDPHSPPDVRGNATLVNQAGFYEAFGVKEGDKMYVAPEARVSIW